MTLTKICRDMDVPGVPHGFRSSFRDWVSEETEFDGAIAEMALAHIIANKVEAAYRRGKLLDKRRVMMDDWADYCLGKPAAVAKPPVVEGEAECAETEVGEAGDA